MKKIYLVLLLALAFSLAGCTQDKTKKETIGSTDTQETSDVRKFYVRDNPIYVNGNKDVEISGYGPAGKKVRILLNDSEITYTKSNKDGEFVLKFPIPDKTSQYIVTDGKREVSIEVLSIADKTAEEEKKEAERKQREEQDKIEAEKRAAEEERAKKEREEQEKKEQQIASASRESRNALKTAEDYLDYSGFSKSGLYDQLIFEEYPPEAAQFAIDNISTDWNENALRTAKAYLEFSSFSDQGLYDQLLFEGYTAEQAQYAVDNLPD